MQIMCGSEGRGAVLESCNVKKVDKRQVKCKCAVQQVWGVDSWVRSPLNANLRQVYQSNRQLNPSTQRPALIDDLFLHFLIKIIFFCMVAYFCTLLFYGLSGKYKSGLVYCLPPKWR